MRKWSLGKVGKYITITHMDITFYFETYRDSNDWLMFYTGVEIAFKLRKSENMIEGLK